MSDSRREAAWVSFAQENVYGASDSDTNRAFDAGWAASGEQREPTEGQVSAALEAWRANDEEYGDVAMRAALRAAWSVR